MVIGLPWANMTGEGGAVPQAVVALKAKIRKRHNCRCKQGRFCNLQSMSKLVRCSGQIRASENYKVYE